VAPTEFNPIFYWQRTVKQPPWVAPLYHSYHLLLLLQARVVLPKTLMSVGQAGGCVLAN